ncbi:hypothetical protein NBRC10512_006792 [Rhodotorula toruloides]|uniref:protein kinase C n=2 Tax=Rhodotorula toruloides TaxID=5286 RepID=A0A061BA03_RHOTO|nr:classical protein kinase C [Rhodotorula toruloides NP11]EMS23285.1 classical protein kinase C [Rhodotorula toruloides NP11]CDR46173.1 RHTO0S12e01222g1_1 [Rhodotorula toruloides]
MSSQLPANPGGADYASKLASLHARIQKERKILEGFQAMRNATQNQDVIRTCDAKIREAQRTIGWFEDSVRELEGRRAAATGGGRSSPAAMEDPRNRPLPSRPPPPPGAAPSYVQPQAYGANPAMHGRVEARDAASAGGPGGMALFGGAKAKEQFTNLDLIKADTPLTTAKISRMLHQLEFKLHVERQYKEGIDKMAKLYMADGDRKARADTENKRVESKQKMVLLSQALKKYKTLDVMGELGEEDDGIAEDAKANLRRPLSGALQITIKSARELAHAPQPKRSKHASETVIYVKVEDTPRARTHGSRNDRWNEDFEIHVDKANEAEVTIYDKVPGEGAPVPIGMLWLRLSDIVEELRRKKMGAEAGPGWVTAARVTQGSGGSGSSAQMNDVPVGGLNREESLAGTFGVGGPGVKGEGIDAWFAVEPEGAIQLHVNFVKSNVRKRPYDAGGLGRQGAVRKRKDSVHEQNGHKFVQKQFYTVVLCALCGEFLLKGAGMQCEDCKYACHAKCYHKVVTKCISKSNTDADKDEEQINHRIPHRFEPITNISPNWCCHCGLVLPLGRKHARKCSECGVTAHTDCIHLVPDFCGMSMEMANKLLSDIKTINSSRRAGVTKLTPAIRPIPSERIQTIPQPPQTPTSAYGQRPPVPAYDMRAQQQLPAEVGRLSLSNDQQQQSASRIPPPALDSYPQRQQQQSLPEQQQPPIAAPPRHSSASTVSSFGNDARDSIGSVFGAYASDAGRPVQQQQQLQQPQPPSFQPYKQPQQQPYGAPPPPAQAQPYPSAATAPQKPQAPFPQQQPQQPYPQRFQQPAPPASTQPSQLYQQPAARIPPPAQQQPPTYGGPAYPQAPQQQPQQVVRPPPQEVAAPVAAPPPVQQQQQQQVAPPQPARQRRIGLEDFNFLAVLGKGNFGKVMLAEEKRSAQLYAIKVLKKEFIIENDEVESTKSEKRVFLAAARERHPFLLGLHSCFQTETRIYFVMEYVSGGDLMLHIQREQFTPRRAKFYAAEVLLALEYFHKNGIVYRDLKLDNILLTLDGHIKIADYGLCKEDMWFGKTTSTFCGTPEFMAPEIILEQRYGRAVDWWAFGVLIYEMLLGQSPFRGDDEDEIFDAILEDEPLYPIHMPKDSVSILTRLLTKDPTRRLGATEADAAEIKNHLFFKDTNWDDIFHKRIPSPFYPNISSATDTSNFDAEFTSEAPTLTPVHSTLSAQDQNEFAGFSWTATWAQ